MIRGYAARDSVVAGDVLWLHVSTTGASFRVVFWRQAAVAVQVAQSGWLAGCVAPVPPHREGRPGRADPAADWGWPGYQFDVPADWPPGIYVADLRERDGAADPSSRVYFVVRTQVAGARSTILYKVATFTAHAYNGPNPDGSQGGSSLYRDTVYVAAGTHGRAFGHKVSMRRPGCAAHFESWDVPFVAWLHRAGHCVEYCTDLDVHENPGLLGAYRLLLSVGHDEYWSTSLREGVETFVRDGGNAAFLGANTCWWRVHLTDDNTALMSDTDHAVGDATFHLPATDLWWAPLPDGVGSPENAITGTSFRNGGAWLGWFTDDSRPLLGFTVQHADHWIFEGTGLCDGSGGGAADIVGDGLALVGYECDGASYEVDEHAVARSDGRDGSPQSFLILGIAVLDPIEERCYEPRTGAWTCFPREAAIMSPRAATMGVYTAGGTVFCAATTNWPVILARDADPCVDRITRNVLDRLAH